MSNKTHIIPDLTIYDKILVNSSGGKDSQYALGVTIDEAEKQGVRDRIVVVHADLGEVEWEGTRELAELQANHYGLRFEVVKRSQGLLDHIRARRRTLDARGDVNAPAWPSSAARYCTSDHKRAQVEPLITKLTKETKAVNGKDYRVRILNVMGFRAEESSARAKRYPYDRGDVLRTNKKGEMKPGRGTNGQRIVDQWLPIHNRTVEEVWAYIKASGVPYHKAYDLGMPRLSCCFCIMAPRAALLLAGKHNPDLLEKYVQVEKEVRHDFRVNLSMLSIQQDLASGCEPGPIQNWTM